MRSQLRITLTQAEVQKHLVRVVAKEQKLPDGEYKCECASAGNGEIVPVFDLPDKDKG